MVLPTRGRRIASSSEGENGVVRAFGRVAEPRGGTSMRPMQTLAGVEVSEGVAIGEVQLLTANVVVQDRSIPHEQVPIELDRLHQAIGVTDHQLGVISGQLKDADHSEGHLILEAHRLMLKSDELVESARGLIRSGGLAAESAVRRVIDRIAGAFDRMNDPYLRERGGDIEALGERLLNTLLGRPVVDTSWHAIAGRVGVGATLSPIDAYHLGRHHLSGLVTEKGGASSHAAILVRTLGIPYVVGVPRLLEQVQEGDMLVVDGSRGDVILNPDPDTLARYKERQHRQAERMKVLRSRGTPVTHSRDGTRFELSANIDARNDVAAAVEAHAETVGLFRTEMLYLNRADLPSEEEQYQDAVAALDLLGGRMATFRTLDLGGDKIPLGVPVPEAANPALGVRAIRFSLLRPELFRTQLRALYRASLHGPMRIMFPLVSSSTELIEARRLCKEVRDSLWAEGTRCPEVPLGVMVETPSAALTVDHLARHCDFFSIGTNDLVQHTFAADRENMDVRHLAPALHPALLRLIQRAVELAHCSKRRISLCGDMAANPAFTWILIGLGLRELSMAPSKLPAVRSVIQRTDLAEAEALVREVLELENAEAIEARVNLAMAEHFALELDLEPEVEPEPLSRWREREPRRAHAGR
jgi:phosphoenolpyruvate-protein phosphotransferase (PTS system enzyme I)